MDTNAETKKIEQEMNETLKSIRALGACLEGSLKENAKAKYVKKDGSVSHYPTAPILQYRIGPKKRGYRRIPASRIEEIRRLLENGKQYRELADRYEALSARLALRFKKKALIPAFPEIRMANLEVLLSEVRNQVVESVEVDLEHLDENIKEASRKDMNALLGDILSLLGSTGKGGTLRKTGADTVLGYVGFKCRYYAPDYGKPVSRQDKRKRERAKEKEKENGAREKENKRESKRKEKEKEWRFRTNC